MNDEQAKAEASVDTQEYADFMKGRSTPSDPEAAHREGWYAGYAMGQAYGYGRGLASGHAGLGAAYGPPQQTPEQKAAQDRGHAVLFVTQNGLAIPKDGAPLTVADIIEAAETLRAYCIDGIVLHAGTTH